MKDYYLVLGISRTADIRKIKKAYRTIAKCSHPDVSQTHETSERFQEIKEAYETLSDESKRKKYDEELSKEQTILNSSRKKAPETIQKNRTAFNEIDSIFSYVDDFFKGFLPEFMERERRPSKDLFVKIILSPQEALDGGLLPLTIPVIETCTRCTRSGIWEDYFCPVCHGKRQIRSDREISLSIPPRVSHDTNIRLSLEDIGLKNSYLNVSVLVSYDLA